MASSCYSRIAGEAKASTTCKDTVFDWKCNDKESIIFVLPGLEGDQTHPNLPQGKGQFTLLCQRLLQSITSAPTRSQTHPNLPQGKERVTLLCQRLQQINSANEHQPPPSLPRRGGTVTIAVDKRLII